MIPKPLPRKRAKPRAWKTPRCLGDSLTGKSRCKQPQKVIERCEKHAKRYLDALRGSLIRKDHCEVPHQELWGFGCLGPIQDNHGFDRDEYPARWELWNGFSGCARLNTWAHHNRRRWYDYLRRTWGTELYDTRSATLDGPRPDYNDVLASLRPAQSKP